MEKDKCVVCGVDTPYVKSVHVDFRENYIEGAGQLCSTCHKEIYDNKKNKK